MTNPQPTSYIAVVFDGPPAHESGRFVEVENEAGKSISAGDWHERPDGLWELRIPMPGASDIDAVARALAFFRSAIKSGESWSSTCDEVYDAATRQLDTMKGDPDA